MPRLPRRRALVRALLSLPAFALLVAAATPSPADARPDDERRRHKMAAPSPSSVVYDFEMDAVAGEMGATPGGAQDIAFFRSRVAAGEIPHPNVFTPEGLFSEHDLPLRTTTRCAQLFCAAGEAIPAGLMVQPEVRYLAQLGFNSGLDPKTWRRAPIHVVAVIDKSGSMSGQPLDLVKESLIQALDHMNPDDQLSIVLYGDRAHVYMNPTAIRDRKAVARAIGGIQSDGSTAMEEGLKVGFDLARRSQRSFQGTTRVMLFTDERPNVGATDAASFMGMARDASKSGIGMTTVGVGVQFGAELATAISSVRGGNLFFFPDAGKMKKVFEEDFDTMVTELAYDLRLEIKPEKGLKLAGVYGIPGKALEWTKEGSIKLSIETIFLSRKKGAIYVALASDTRPGLPETRVTSGSPVATVKLAYTQRGGGAQSTVVSLPTVTADAASIGLQRGRILVDQATTLAKAASLHHEKNDQEGAYQLVHALAGLLRQSPDSDLAEERTMVQELERTLAKLSGHAGEPAPIAAHSEIDRISGLPLKRPAVD
ncbi:MAG: VWA domain-containing protein [Nannocystaceae bacterium]